MASYQKRGNNWRAVVRKRGISKSRTFHSKARAVAWATKLENEILDGIYNRVENKTFGELLQRYEKDVSVNKKGYQWEAVRIRALLRDPLADIKLENLGASDFAAWRDRRLKQVKSATVRRDWNLLNHAINMAINEWEWLTNNPLKQVRRPAPSPHRDRLFTENEIERILHSSGYTPGQSATELSARIGAAFIFACETGMRASEIASLRPDVIDTERRTAVLKQTKNGFPRVVPLPSKAIAVLDDLPGGYFELTADQISSHFPKILKRAIVLGATFHDSRHFAITQLAKKLDVLDLARMVGTRDLKTLMTYYNETPEEIARKLG